MKAKIRVRQGDHLVTEYEIKYSNVREMRKLYHEARKVWDDYNVVMETSTHNVSYSHTYKEQYFKR